MCYDLHTSRKSPAGNVGRTTKGNYTQIHKRRLWESHNINWTEECESLFRNNNLRPTLVNLGEIVRILEAENEKLRQEMEDYLRKKENLEIACACYRQTKEERVVLKKDMATSMSDLLALQEESSETELSLSDSPPAKKVKTKEPTKERKVKKAYFRWTNDRNVDLVTAVIDTWKELEGRGYEPTEAEILRNVCERKAFPAEKIRDQLNNLLARYISESSKASIRELKADNEEYKNLLHKIRRLHEKKVDNLAMGA